MSGRVLYGINNIYRVLVDERELTCGIRGKILKSEDTGAMDNAYNPIAVGDRVRVMEDPHSRQKGWITARERRHSSLIRYNKKRKAPQTLAANIDLMVCVTSASSPPFRPRFIDRLLVSAQVGNVASLIFVNKCDLRLGEQEKQRLAVYRKIGYPVLMGSALTGEGMAELGKALHERVAVFVGQSGVGKSRLLNRLDPTLSLKVGNVSRKYDRGGHTTNYAVMVRLGSLGWIIDTPGIRELEIFGIEPEELGFYFPEFIEPARGCGFSSCNHIEEPDCRVKDAVGAGIIHEDRYESYVRIYSDLKVFREESYG